MRIFNKIRKIIKGQDLIETKRGSVNIAKEIKSVMLSQKIPRNALEANIIELQKADLL